MPKTTIDYSKNVIYKIVCNDPTIVDCYVGHTTDFVKRKAQHKSLSNTNHSYLQYNLYKTIKDTGGWTNWSMIMVEEFPCDNSAEAAQREYYWVSNLGAKLNTYNPIKIIKDKPEINNVAINYMTDIKEFIKTKRPTLGDSSVTTYASILKNLFKNVFGGDMDFKKFDNVEPILNYLKDLPPNKRKTILSALVVVTDDKKYRELMLEDIKDYNKEIDKQEKSEAQKDNWVEPEEIKSLWNTLKKNADLLYKKGTLDNSDLQSIQSFIILSLLGGIFISPRRSLDYVDFKIKNISKETDNYLDKKDLVFNSFKTAKCYGEQRVTIPTALKSILTKWIKVNPTEFLLFDVNGGQLSSVKLNQRLNKLFGGKKVGVNILRHSYLTDKYAEHSATKKAVAATMSEMGSSPAMLETYVKTD